MVLQPWWCSLYCCPYLFSASACYFFYLRIMRPACGNVLRFPCARMRSPRLPYLCVLAARVLGLVLDYSCVRCAHNFIFNLTEKWAEKYNRLLVQTAQRSLLLGPQRRPTRNRTRRSRSSTRREKAPPWTVREARLLLLFKTKQKNLNVLKSYNTVFFAVGAGKFHRLKSNITFGCGHDKLLKKARRRVAELNGLVNECLTVRVLAHDFVRSTHVDNGAALNSETLAQITALPSTHIMGTSDRIGDVVARVGLAGGIPVLLLHAAIAPGGPDVTTTASVAGDHEVFGALAAFVLVGFYFILFYVLFIYF